MEGLEGTEAIWEGETIQDCRRFRGMIDGVVREAIKTKELKLTNLKADKRIAAVRGNVCVMEQVNQIILELVEDVKGCRRTLKSDVTSRNLRQEANEFYKRRELAAALKGFTLSLCFAPYRSIEMVLAYSNRSACFLELNEPVKCLQDIYAALTELENISEVPKELEVVRKKLLERKERCEVRINDSESLAEKVETETRQWECENYFQLKNPSCCIESAEDFVEIVFDPIRGRHVKVTRDVPPGTVIILEKPYSKILVKQVKWEIAFCHFCFKDISKSHCVPCTVCVFALYCNQDCKKSHEDVHKYDCVLGPHLHRLDSKRLVLLSYRTVINLGPDELYKEWKNQTGLKDKKERSTKSILGFENGKYLSSSYHPIKCLIYHDESLTEEELTRYCIDSIIISELMYKNTEFYASFVDDNELLELKNFAAYLMLLHQMNFPCNAHSLNVLQLSSANPPAEEIQGATTTDFGAGAFALLSMINHSCDPNVTRITLSNGMNAVVTIRGLKEDEEVLDNYGAHYALEDLPSRRNHLKTNYNFICDCIACTKAWPVLGVLQDQVSKFICNACFKKSEFERLKLDRLVLQPHGQCKHCKSVHDLNSLDKELARNIEQFRYAFSLTLQNKPYKSIQTIIESLGYFESQLLPPYIYTNFAQETLKQALNLLATYE